MTFSGFGSFFAETFFLGFWVVFVIFSFSGLEGVVVVGSSLGSVDFSQTCLIS